MSLLKIIFGTTLIVLINSFNVKAQTYTYGNGIMTYEGVTIGTKVKIIYNSVYDTYKITFKNSDGILENWVFKPDIGLRKFTKKKYHYQISQGNIENYLFGPPNYWIINGSLEFDKYALIYISPETYDPDNMITISHCIRVM